MKKLKIDLENCYGIKKLTYTFDFSSHNIYAIYAPNGTMKTSFSKTINDLSENKDTKDLIFSERVTLRNIQNEDDEDCPTEQFFVIEPYNKSYSSDKISTLVVKKELKDRYDLIYADLDKAKVAFIKKLKLVSKSSDCELEIIEAFKDTPKDAFLDILLRISPEVSVPPTDEYTFKYNDIFDRKGNVKKFLDKNLDELDDYINQYESLLSQSSFFKKSDNTFGTQQVNEMLKSVKDNSFFDAGHLLELSDTTKITSTNEFSTFVKEEIDKILNDKDLKKLFEKIDKAIGSNTELRTFKTIIEQDNLLLIELKNYEEFKKKVWISYLQSLKSDALLLAELFTSKKEELQEIIKEANNTKTEWATAIKEFNTRFMGIPFTLDITNQDDVILKTSTPFVKFTFKDTIEEREVNKDELLQVLSQGERRALYLLNIIFEIQARRQINQETIFIIDDIADSFDYKNKYAIIEYLKDISSESNFYQIILTHNFDFFRTVGSRLGIKREHRLYTIKSDNEVTLIKEKYQKNPFENWIQNVNSNNNFLIALIPFVRNLTEYTKGNTNNTDYDKLTELLHIKQDTKNLTHNDLASIFQNTIPSISLSQNTCKVIDTLYSCAEVISLETIHSEVDLEKKIVLSIAIRLKAEEFMIDKISNFSTVNAITGNQTFELFKIYKNKFTANVIDIESLDKVNLMTAENIHLNSFMYEPLLDMSDSHLKALYTEIKSLT
ncbi:MAG: hypothetical protein COA66_13765 [Arcobacter sp.]|nr:MAG: hypothetical protein COA66_13765 [Arcobacter sp.]